MLFTQHINSLTTSVSNIQNQIDELEVQLKELRNNKANLEAELQTVLTLEGAAESALSQSQSFINAAESLGRYDLIETFWTALDSLQNGAIAILPETPETVNQTESEPTNPTEPEPNAITVEATEPDNQSDNQSDTQSESQSDIEPRPLASVGSSGFNPSTADLDTLKRWVRSYQDDNKTRQQGSLTRRSTWEHAAKSIPLNNG
ncbi:hypothetical protein [Planktothrix mougeotii]|uniref:Uncharacterized protein n=1 Tax=Planktothrix mougeotii LEGE 06226 TaxID=1828728 RepID=A0ABR9UGF9_9CYAN|nr:hypothetical protein [Planktothrix mougeotii]MBE9144901.1 hypothetical protein [Planktothrix mougeotii LEGE 06226]